MHVSHQSHPLLHGKNFCSSDALFFARVLKLNTAHSDIFVFVRHTPVEKVRNAEIPKWSSIALLASYYCASSNFQGTT